MDDDRPTKKVASPGAARESPLHPLRKLLAKNSQGISHLLPQIRKISEITREVTVVLPTHLLSHCQVLNLQGNTLIMEVESSAWVLRLRYECPALLEHLKENGWPELKDIRIRMGSPKIPPPPIPRAVMKSETVEFLRSVAQECHDPEFRAAWERLANRDRQS
ncbi:conserved hypothetical protein [Gammaproteobacteria bacterium]